MEGVKPMIVTLCGSARFEPWFHMWSEALGMAGHSVFGLASYPSQHEGEKDWYTAFEKLELDKLHMRKIGSSEAVVVLNVFGYVGNSTKGEIEYATALGKQVLYLESWGKGVATVSQNHKPAYIACAEKFGVPFGYRSPLRTMNLKDLWSPSVLGDASMDRSALVNRLYARLEAIGAKW